MIQTIDNPWVASAGPQALRLPFKNRRHVRRFLCFSVRKARSSTKSRQWTGFCCNKNAKPKRRKGSGCRIYCSSNKFLNYLQAINRPILRHPTLIYPVFLWFHYLIWNDLSTHIQVQDLIGRAITTERNGDRNVAGKADHEANRV